MPTSITLREYPAGKRTGAGFTSCGVLPDEVDSHPTGGSYQRPSTEGGGETTTYPFEDWRYRYLEGMGEDVELEFVDPTSTGEYHLTMDPSEKDALLYVPGAGLTMAEEMGMASKADRFSNIDGTHDAAPIGMASGNQGGAVAESMNEFTRMQKYADIFRPPPVKFKDLEAVVTSRLVRDQVKFEYRFDFMRITSDTVLVPITIQIPRRQMSFQEKNGVDTSTMNLFARVSTLSGRIVQTFEDTVTTGIVAERSSEVVCRVRRFTRRRCRSARTSTVWTSFSRT